MADMPPNNPLPGTPSGVTPLKKSTGKVQPKKETVRINLPPKPTAAPTIKLPTLPPGGPTGATSPAPMPAAAPAPAVKITTVPAAPAKPAVAATPAATATPQRPVAATPRPAAAGAPSIGTLDTYLIYGAAVAGLVAVGGATWIFFILKNSVETFSR
jgi:hypothetical protein